MKEIWFYVIAVLVGFILGYITKDILTIEKKIDVTIKKQKVKGENNRLEADVSVQVEEKKQRKGLFSKLKRRNFDAQ